MRKEGWLYILSLVASVRSRALTGDNENHHDASSGQTSCSFARRRHNTSTDRTATFITPNIPHPPHTPHSRVTFVYLILNQN